MYAPCGAVAVMEARVQGALKEADNYRGILLRQQSIKGFWREPSRGFLAKEAEVRQLQAQLATLDG